MFMNVYDVDGKQTSVEVCDVTVINHEQHGWIVSYQDIELNQFMLPLSMFISIQVTNEN